MAKILILDDEKTTVEMFSIFVKMSGHEPIGVLSVQEFWHRLETERPDAFLLDLMLPDGNGLEICYQIRQQLPWRTIPIIITSAQFPPMIREAEVAGASYYLSKPLRMEMFKEALGSVGIPVGSPQRGAFT